MLVTRLMCTAAVCILVLTGCGAEHRSDTASNLNQIDATDFRRVVEDAATALLVPGAVVALRTPQGSFDVAVGTTQLGSANAPDVQTRFRIASNTKTMTAALVMLLAQDGKLALDDPVGRYVAGVPNGANITVEELLTMRSGLYGYTDDPELSEELDRDPARAWTPQQVLAIAYRHPPRFAPGTEYDYSNTNYALLGLVAENAGGRTLSEQFRDRLLNPLGLDQTTLPAVDDTTIPAPGSHGYMYGPTRYALIDEPYPAPMQAEARAGTVQPIDYTNQNPSYATAAGGVISTADNLLTWIRALVTRSGARRGHPEALAGRAAGRGSRPARRKAVRIRHHPSALRAERGDVLPRWRAARLQLVHGPRPGKRCDAGDLDQSDLVAGRANNRQRHAATDSR